VSRNIGSFYSYVEMVKVLSRTTEMARQIERKALFKIRKVIEYPHYRPLLHVRASPRFFTHVGFGGLGAFFSAMCRNLYFNYIIAFKLINSYFYIFYFK